MKVEVKVEVDDVDIHNGITVAHFEKKDRFIFVCVGHLHLLFYFILIKSPPPQVGIAYTFLFFFAVLLLNPISCSRYLSLSPFKGSIGLV